MSSRKFKRYGQGGSNHKKTPNQDRPNGKAWKKRPKNFDTITRQLETTTQQFKGRTV